MNKPYNYLPRPARPDPEFLELVYGSSMPHCRFCGAESWTLPCRRIAAVARIARLFGRRAYDRAIDWCLVD